MPDTKTDIRQTVTDRLIANLPKWLEILEDRAKGANNE